MTTCPRNLPQHFNGCTCTSGPGTVTAEASVDLLERTGSHTGLTAIAVLNAIAEAKATGKPALIAHPSGNRIDLDEQRTGNSAGDCSVGAEPSIRYTWATGRDDEPFITVTDTSWISARLNTDEGTGSDNLDYDDWEAVKETYEMWESDQDNPVCDCSASSGLKGHGKDPAQCRVHGDVRTPPEPPSLVYAREDVAEWIAHTDPNDPGSTEIRSDYERGVGSSFTYSGLASAEDDARGHVQRLKASHYSPENWK